MTKACSMKVKADLGEDCELLMHGHMQNWLPAKLQLTIQVILATPRLTG